MIPIRDEIKARRVPVVNTLLIIVNVIVFCLQWLLASEQSEAILYQFAFVPYNFLMAPIKFSNLRNIFTAMFMHAGLLHLGGNMLYLWIFGDNVEDRMGHGRFLVFYLLSGAGAALAQTVADPSSPMPVVGASGAIAGVMGAYLMIRPCANIKMLIFVAIVRVRAMWVIAAWALLQLWQAFAHAQEEVAWWAHIGGLAAGLILIQFLMPKPPA